jgi:FSR family fosmidomycin resistance protein-like MFS transporter
MSQDASLALETPVQPVRLAGTAFLLVLLGHVFVDILSTLMPASLGLFEVRLGLSARQSAWILGLGPLCSGLSQPICALISDRHNSRALGLVGIILGGLGIGSLGMASNATTLALTYALGMMGIGMFHPVGAATIGKLREHKRHSAMSMFFVAGMCGGVLGALAWPRLLLLPLGFRYLPLALVPALALVVVMQRSFAQLAPVGHSLAGIPVAPGPRANWALVGLLYFSACLKFCVNMALVYLYVRWAQSTVSTEHAHWTAAEVANFAAPLVGNLNAAMLLGMALGGLSAGLIVRTDREKWPLVCVPILFAPMIALFPHVPLGAGYVIATLAGIGFASMIPVSIALAQHLLPHRSTLASSLIMGGAWAVATVGPGLAEFGVNHLGLSTTFLLTAFTLAASGLACTPLPNATNRG